MERYAVSLHIQPVAAWQRRKNRVVVTYRRPDGSENACGGYSVSDAVQKAAARIQTSAAKNVLSIPGPPAETAGSGGKSERSDTDMPGGRA